MARKQELTAGGTALLTQIGMRGHSFFDNGIVADSGIWMECLTAESGAAKTPKGVANVARKLADDGFLNIEQVGDPEGVWVTLTAKGAETALALAEANASGHLAPEPVEDAVEAPAQPAQEQAPVAGLKWYGKVRETSTYVSIYDGRLSGHDTEGGRWQTVCEEHGVVASHRTSDTAWVIGAHPLQWCKKCAAAAAKAAKA